MGNKETNYQTARSRSAEASKVAYSASTETAKTFSAESVLSLRKNHQWETVPVLKRKEQKCTAELLKTARQISEDSLKTAQEPKRDLPRPSQESSSASRKGRVTTTALFAPALQMAKKGSKRNAASLNTAQKDDRNASGKLRWSTMKSKSPLIREEMKERERFLKTTQKHRKVPTKKPVEQKPPLNAEQNEKMFIKARGTDDPSGRQQKKPLSLESWLRNKQADKTARKRNMISNGERKRPKSSEEAALKTAREHSGRKMRRSLRSRGLQVSKKDFEEELLKTAREADQISSRSSSSTILQDNASKINGRSLFSKNTLNMQKFDSKQRHPRMWDASAPVTELMDDSFDRMKKQNKGDEQKERKSQYEKSASERANGVNMAKLQSIEKEEIIDLKDRQISSKISCKYHTSLPNLFSLLKVH